MKTRTSLILLAVLALAAVQSAQAAIITLDGTSGSNTISTSYSTDGNLTVDLGFFAEYLIVGGGGGGGNGREATKSRGGGGGGAGGLLTNVGGTLLQVGAASLPVVVGAGGAAGLLEKAGSNGGNSSFYGITAIGGGGGGGYLTTGGSQQAGRPGGSGGGGYSTGGAGTSGQGYNGGNGSDAGAGYGGGGGGAGQVGQNASGIGGNGGNGLQNAITGTGTSIYYAGGGGGRRTSTGGLGGGGDDTTGQAGTDGLGGGGGGGTTTSAGKGGSGVVVVRYAGAEAGTGGAISSASGITVHQFTGSSSLDLSGLDLNARLGATLTSAVTGTGAFTYNGPGKLTLAGANIYTGGTTVSNGWLIGTSTSALGVNSGLNIANGATFAYRPTAAGALDIGTGVLTLNGGATIGAALGGTAGQSAITSTAAASVPGSGTVTVDIWGMPGVAPATGSNNLITAASGLDAGASFVLGKVYNNTDFTVSALSTSGTAISTTVTSETPLAAAYWTGTAAAGITKVWAASDGSTTSNWSATSGGTVQALIPTAVDVTIVGTTVAATDTTLGANMTVKTLTISDTTNGLGLNADGFTLTITPASSSAGITMDASVPASAIAAKVALGADQTWTNNSSAGLLTVSGSITNGANLLTIGGSGNTTLSGGIGTGAGGLTKNDAGTLTLSGNSTFTGATTVNAGTLKLGHANALGGTAGNTAVTAGAVLDLNGVAVAAEPVTINGTGISGGGALVNSSGTAASLAGAVTIGTAGTSIGGTGDITLSAALANNANSFVKVGNGKLTLSVNSARTGNTQIDGGILRINDATAFGTTATTITINAGTLEIGTTNTIATGGGITLNNGGTISSGLAGTAARIDKTINVAASGTAVVSFDSGANAANVFTINGGGNTRLTGGATGARIQIKGSGEVDVGESGQTRTNTVIADWYLQSGKLRIRADASPGELGNAANDLYFQGGTLITDGAFTLGSGRVLDFSNASGGTIDTTGGNLTLGTDGQLSGANPLTKAGNNSLILSAANAGFSGTTTVNAGTLRLTNTSAIGSSSSLSLATGTTLQLRSDTAATFNTPAITPAATGASVTIDVNNNGSGSGNTLALSSGLNSQFTTAGTLTVNVTGGNTYALSIPTVNLGGGNSLTLNPTTANLSIGTLSATTNAPTANNITLTLGGTGTANSITTINETSNAGQQLIITKNTAATWTLGNVDTKQGNGHTVTNGNLILNGTFTFGISSATARTFTISGGTLHYNNIGAVQTKGTGAVLVMTTGSLDNTSGAAITTSTYNPNMQWGGNWTFIGSNGAASDLYLGTGPVAITGSTRQVTVQDAATTLTVGGIISGTSFGLTKAGAGTLKLTGASAYTGPTSITAGKLKIDTAGTINTTSSLTINGPTAEFMYNNSTTAFSKAITFTQGTLSGTGKIGVAVTVPVGGTLAPGASTGTLTVVGNTALNGTFLVDVDNLGGSDLLAVTGNLTLGGVLTIADLSKLVYPVYTIATYTGSLGGSSFASTNLGTTAYTVDTTSTPGSVLLVPEPATMALLALGGLGLLLSRKRK